ncbi:MAG: hypothetical protein AAF292_05515 [Pseudomonadota bacterium]
MSNTLNRLASLSVSTAAFIAFSATAQEYTHGNGALELFDSEGIANSPTWVRIWIIFMLASFAAGLLFVRRRIEARMVVGGFVLGMLALMVLQGAFGLPPISGFIALIHLIAWTPGLIVLLRRRTFLKERSLYGAWTGLITAVILFSFVFDIRDAAIYLDHIAGVGLFS